MAVALGFAAGFLGGRCLVGQAFGFFGFDFRFDIERLFVVIGFLGLRRRGGGLRGEQRLRRFQRMHLFAAIDDKGLLAGHGRVGDDRERDLEAFSRSRRWPRLWLST